MNPFLFVALDNLAENENEAFRLAAELQLTFLDGVGLKVNLDYVLNPRRSLGEAVLAVKRYTKQIFVDLKMWNGSRTMQSVVENLVDLEVDYLNVYALADNQLSQAIRATEGSKTRVLGLTVLSHYTDQYCQKHFRRSFQETVRHFAEIAIENGCHGIILPGNCLSDVRDLKTIKAATGIRPDWYHDDRHEQEATPRFAAQEGAEILVCGGPITKSQEKAGITPKEALDLIIAEIR